MKPLGQSRSVTVELRDYRTTGAQCSDEKVDDVDLSVLHALTEGVLSGFSHHHVDTVGTFETGCGTPGQFFAQTLHGPVEPRDASVDEEGDRSERQQPGGANRVVGVERLVRLLRLRERQISDLDALTAHLETVDDIW